MDPRLRRWNNLALIIVVSWGVCGAFLLNARLGVFAAVVVVLVLATKTSVARSHSQQDPQGGSSDAVDS
jgi:hypothetical protein